MTAIAEFSRPVDVSRLGKAGRRESIEATPAELKALAARMKLPAIHSLSARLEILPWKKGKIRVHGQLRASLDQECVRTLDIFTSTLEAPVERLYAPDEGMTARRAEDAREVEIDPLAEDEPDTLRGGKIDLGELVAETLALSLDPWPKKPGTDFTDYSTDGKAAAEPGKKPSPFAGLEALRKKD